MKKGLIGIVLVVFAVLVWWMFVGGDQEDLADYNPHLEKEEKKETSQTDKLLKNIENANVPRLYGRMVFGESMEALSEWPDNINFLNKTNPNWDKLASNHLMKSSTYDRKVKITKKEGFIALNGEDGLYLERGFVEFKQPDGSDGSFDAIFNGESGEIELVLNENINEDLPVEDMKIDYPDPMDPKNFMASEEEIRELEEADSDEIVGAMVAKANEDFDPYEYEEQAQIQARSVEEQDTDENHKRYVESLKRKISSED
jgi:hypothetical protein